MWIAPEHSADYHGITVQPALVEHAHHLDRVVCVLMCALFGYFSRRSRHSKRDQKDSARIRRDRNFENLPLRRGPEELPSKQLDAVSESPPL